MRRLQEDLPRGTSMSPSSASENWLSQLLLDVDSLLQPRPPRPYYSQRNDVAEPNAQRAVESTAQRLFATIDELVRQNFFARAVGYDCIDNREEPTSTFQSELGKRIRKPELWDGDFALWSENDLCDFAEVMYDLVARPTREWYHDYSACGWHPISYSISSGQGIFLWRANSVLDSSGLGLRLAEHGEDRGRIVRTQPANLESLVDESLTNHSSVGDEVGHAVALFRKRDSARPEKRSAVVGLAGILESRRSLIQSTQLSTAEDALFQIANRFDIRHRKANQLAEYDDSFLDWIFYWYLATINLTEHLLGRSN